MPAGADEVVILNLAGEVTEASVANIAFARDGRFVTPPLSRGHPRRHHAQLVLGAVRPPPVSGPEKPIRPADFASMDECFLLSTTKDIVPVGEIDGVKFRLGPDTVDGAAEVGIRAGPRVSLREPIPNWRPKPGPCVSQDRPRVAQDRPGLRR